MKENEFDKLCQQMADAHNEGLRSRREFRIQLVTVIAAIFGVLVALYHERGEEAAHYLYAFMVLSCAVSLILMLISLYAPIYANNQRWENLKTKLIKSLGLPNKEYAPQKGKLFNWCMWGGIVWFGISIILSCIYIFMI